LQAARDTVWNDRSGDSPLASAKRRDYWKWAAASPCRARLRGGCKPAQLSRLAWLRPPIRSVLAPPRPPAPAQRIGSLTLPAAPGSHLYQPDHCDRLPLSGEPDRPPSALWLANGRHVRAGNGQRTNAFFPESGQTRGFPCRFWTSFLHSRPRPRSPSIRRWAFPWRSHRAEIRFALD
jgi:hypothetical protein